jgi:hypothetical protein
MLRGFILYNRNVDFRAHKSRPLDLILGQFNLNHTHSIYLRTTLILSSHPHPDGLHSYVFASSSVAKDDSLMNRLHPCQVYVSHIQRVIENSSLYTIYKFSVSTGFAEQIMPILRILCHNGSLVTWTVVSLTTAKFKPLIFSMSGFALSCTANMFILMILYDFCLLPAQICYIIVCIRKADSRVQIANRCALWKISNGADELVASNCPAHKISARTT